MDPICWLTGVPVAVEVDIEAVVEPEATPIIRGSWMVGVITVLGVKLEAVVVAQPSPGVSMVTVEIESVAGVF